MLELFKFFRTIKKQKEIIEQVKEYLKHPSVDGSNTRKLERNKLKELVNSL